MLIEGVSYANETFLWPDLNSRIINETSFGEAVLLVITFLRKAIIA